MASVEQHGLVFPADDEGRRSTTAVGRAVVADALTPVDATGVRAMGRQPQVPNAVSGREGAFTLFVLGVLATGIEDVVPAVGMGVVDALRPWATGTAPVNWLGDATPAEVARAWRREVHARLMEVKRAVDPGNVFRFGHALGT